MMHLWYLNIPNPVSDEYDTVPVLAVNSYTVCNSKYQHIRLFISQSAFLISSQNQNF